MKLFEKFRKKTQEPEKPAEKPELEAYSGMRVEVTDLEGQLLFVSQLLGLTGDGAKLDQYSQTVRIPGAGPWHIQLRGYSDRERKAVYLEGILLPAGGRLWRACRLKLVKAANERAFFRLDTMLDATVTSFHGANAGEHPCLLLNISVGGAGVRLKEKYHEGDKFLLKAKLLEDQPLSAMYCQVLRVIERGKDGFEYGCKFLELTEADQETITQNIFAAQRKRRG